MPPTSRTQRQAMGDAPGLDGAEGRTVQPSPSSIVVDSASGRRRATGERDVGDAQLVAQLHRPCPAGPAGPARGARSGPAGRRPGRRTPARRASTVGGVTPPAYIGVWIASQVLPWYGIGQVGALTGVPGGEQDQLTSGSAQWSVPAGVRRRRAVGDDGGDQAVEGPGAGGDDLEGPVGGQRTGGVGLRLGRERGQVRIVDQLQDRQARHLRVALAASAPRWPSGRTRSATGRGRRAARPRRPRCRPRAGSPARPSRRCWPRRCRTPRGTGRPRCPPPLAPRAAAPTRQAADERHRRPPPRRSAGATACGVGGSRSSSTRS